MQRRWIGRTANQEDVTSLARECQLHPLVARVLVARGIRTPGAVQTLLHAGRSTLYNPALLHDAPKAAQRIRRAIDNQETILIYGDYDVDGTCATAILVRALRTRGANPLWRVPDRFAEGYGLHPHVIHEAAEQGVTLIVTVDTGITATEAAQAARQHGIDLIITDHHHIPSAVPTAFAVVHPDYPRSLYPCKDLCGAGVAFKLAELVLGRFPEELLPYVALATVADQVPLTGENRILVREGLHEINRTPDVGIAALADVAGAKHIRASDIAFQLGPRMNSVGRLDHARHVVDLLLTDDPVTAARLALVCQAHNRFRQTLQERIYQEAFAQIEAHPSWQEHATLVVSGTNWHEGVIGIVAGKLAERFYKPTLCISEENGKGSGRTVPGLDLYRVLSEVEAQESVFARFGGHAAAAGFTLRDPTPVDALRERFAQTVADTWPDDVPKEPYTDVDAPLPIENINLTLAQEIERLEPFGQGNPSPLFFIKEAQIAMSSLVGKNDKHLRLRLRAPSLKRGAGATVIGFGFGNDADALAEGSVRHLLVHVERNVFGNQVSLQLRLSDWR